MNQLLVERIILAGALGGAILVVYGGVASLRTVLRVRRERQKMGGKIDSFLLKELAGRLQREGPGAKCPEAMGGVLQEAYDDLHTYIAEQEEIREREYGELKRELQRLREDLDRLAKKVEG